MIRSLFVLCFYALLAPFIALIGFPWTLVSGKADRLYRMAMWTASTGLRLAGVKARVIGRERLDLSRNYIFMCNHVSNLDPPIVLPLVLPNTSVLVKRELFRIPLLGRAMRLTAMVPVDRSQRDAAIESVQAAATVVKSGRNMTIFPEGTRSRDGRLLPFKKGPFYLARESGVPVVPVTVVGTYEMLPKGKFALRPGTATVVFHEAVDPAAFPTREGLMTAVRDRIASALPQEAR